MSPRRKAAVGPRSACLRSAGLLALAGSIACATATHSPPHAPATHPGPGISLELARHRAATLHDIRYDLAFRVPRDRDQPVTGSATISFRRTGSGPLVLDFADPSRVRALTVGGQPVDWRADHGHIVVSGDVIPDGAAASVSVEFEAGDAPLNRRDDFLYTLFVPDRAHEAFPSFDQPDLKARFRLRLTIPEEWTAVSNGALRSRDGAWEFAETEPLPTYLFSFAAGRFQVEETEREGRTLRLFHRETDADKVARNREAIFDLHATALEWLEEYTGIPYPFGKFDLVAIPSFQYNGMEHPGAILYRASSLFLDESATRNQELGRASVIAHETAHMWFGDLVTMRWFDDVWMKEVFANFMAAKIVNPSFPELDHDLRFLLAHYPAAYSVDRTAGANAIRQPLENLDDAGTLYGAIIYQKAPIVMRQLERLTGEEAFRTALRRYLDAHRFGNAGWPALVAELDAVTELDVPAWSRVWIEEPGRPEIAVARTADGSGGGAAAIPGPTRITLQPRDPEGRGRVWPQATTVGAALAVDSGPGEAGRRAPPARIARRDLHVPTRSFSVTLAGETETVGPLPMEPPNARSFVLPNADGLGYGLFVLDDETVATLLDVLPRLPRPLTRAVAWLDLREMMLDDRIDSDALLDLALRIAAVEDDELVAQQVLGDLTDLFWLWSTPALRLARGAEIENLLWERVQEADGASAKAAYFNAWRSIATTPAAIDRMRALWAGDLDVEGLPLSERDLSDLALQLAVRDAPDARVILDAQEERIENPDRRDRFRFVRRAASPDPAVRSDFFRSLADVENRAREEWVVAALSLLHHPLRAADSVDFIRPALDLLLEVKRTGDIFFPTRWLAATLGGHRSSEAAAIVQGFIDEHPEYPPRLMGKLLQEADPLFRVARPRSD